MRNPLADVRLTIARRDLSSLSREKTIVLALLIQLFIAAFSSFLVVGLTSLYEPSSIEGEEVVVGVSGDASRELVRAGTRTTGIRVVPFDDQSQAIERFDAGAVSAVLSATTQQTDSGRIVDVAAIAPEQNLRTTLVVVQIRSLLTELERSERFDRAEYLDFVPLELPQGVDASQYFGFTYTILIPLLLFLPPFISGSVAVDTFTEEIERGTLTLLRVAPVSLTDVVDGKALGMILLAPVQALLWVLLLGVNGIGVSNVLPLLALVTAIGAILVVLGLGLGLVTRKRRQAQLLYSVLALLVFGLAVVLPEHPATTAAKLAVASATGLTVAHVAGFVVLAVLAVLALRAYAGRVDAESLT